MLRLVVLLFSFACVIYSDSVSEYPAGLVWLGKPQFLCGGVLVEPDVVIAEAACVGDETRVIWPYKSEIKYTVKTRRPNSRIAIFFLENILPNPVELSRQVLTKQSVWTSNTERTIRDWVQDVRDLELTVEFGFKTEHGWGPSLLSAPIFTEPVRGVYHALGLMIGESTALRLGPYIESISAELQSACLLKTRVFCQVPQLEQALAVIPAVVSDSTIAIPARVVISEKVEQAISTVMPIPPEKPGMEAVVRPPESLGCSCSQVK